MTDVQICNYALLIMGDTEGIASMTENTKPSRVCSRVYELTRQTLLDEYPWNFAVKQKKLVRVTDETNQEFDFVYEYPADCLRVLKIFPHAEGEVISYKTIYTEDDNEDVRRIVCNLDDAYVEYIMDLQNESAFPPKFSKVLSYAIAKEISMSLTTDARILNALDAGYDKAFAKAKYLIANEQRQPVNQGTPRALKARR